MNLNPGQEQFLNFILERTQDGKAEEMQALLGESFQKQADGTFTPEYLADFTPKMLALLKPEHVEEVRQITENFGKGR